MHRIVLVIVLALAAVPAAFAADSPSPSSQAGALCKAQRTALGAKDFASLYGGSKNAYGRCVSKLAGSVQHDTANAAKQCAAERSDTAFAGAHDSKTFEQYYGTGKRGHDAFGKCVSAKAKTLTDAKQQATVNAAKACKAERTQMGAAAFATKYGHSNAFGKCVSKATQATH